FVRGSLDRNHTQNDLLQQGALPSTGATTTSNYYNSLVNNQLQFSTSLLGTLTLEASGFHHTKVRNSEIGEAFNFPFTVSFLTTLFFARSLPATPKPFSLTRKIRPSTFQIRAFSRPAHLQIQIPIVRPSKLQGQRTVPFRKASGAWVYMRKIPGASLHHLP